MKKMGSIQFYQDVDMKLKFNFDDLMQKFEKNSEGIKFEFLDDDEKTMKLDIIDKYVTEFVNQKIKEKYGDDYSLDVMDETMNISWNINVESIKKTHIENWWEKDK